MSKSAHKYDFYKSSNTALPTKQAPAKLTKDATSKSRDGQSAPIWSQLQFDPWSFDGSNRLLEILRWSFSSPRVLELFEMEL